MNPNPKFDHEKLDVYQVELAFVAWANPLLLEVKNAAPGFHREVCDQLDRTRLSALLNTAEGNGRRPGQQRAKFFDDARGSAVECAACLDAIVAKGLTQAERIVDGKVMLLRIVGMLSKLVTLFDNDSSRLREDAPDSAEGSPPPRPRTRPSSSKNRAVDEPGAIEHEHEHEGRGGTSR